MVSRGVWVMQASGDGVGGTDIRRSHTSNHACIYALCEHAVCHVCLCTCSRCYRLCFPKSDFLKC